MWEIANESFEIVSTTTLIYSAGLYLCYFCVVRRPCVTDDPAAVPMSIIYLYPSVRRSNGKSIAVPIESYSLDHVPVAMLLNSEATRVTRGTIHYHR